MLLWGKSPAAILDVAGQALAFWDYQKRQIESFLQHQHTQLSEKYQAEKSNSQSSSQLLAQLHLMQEKLERKDDDLKKMQQIHASMQSELDDAGRQLAKWSQMYEARQQSPAAAPGRKIPRLTFEPESPRPMQVRYYVLFVWCW